MRSFVKNASSEGEGATAVAEAPAPEAAPKNTAVARPMASAYVGGDIDSSDMRVPFLGCVQAVGPNSVKFTSGSLILGEDSITEAPKPKEPTPRLRVLFCRVQKTYVQNLPYDATPGAPRPKILHTAAEVLADGGILEWRGHTPPTYMPKLTCLALIRQPEGLDNQQFCLILGDKTYAPAQVSFQKTGYSAAKTLLTDLSLSLKNNPTATFYDLFYAREQKGQNWVWVPKLVRVRDEQPAADLQAIAGKMSGAQVAIEDDTEA